MPTSPNLPGVMQFFMPSTLSTAQRNPVKQISRGGSTPTSPDWNGGKDTNSQAKPKDFTHLGVLHSNTSLRHCEPSWMYTQILLFIWVSTLNLVLTFSDRC